MRVAWNRSPHGGALGRRHIPLAACLALEGLKGCQTKMVLGLPCAAPIRLDARLLREAIRRLVHDFAFVGLTEAWEASVCLFHARLGGGAPVAAQFLNGRPGSTERRDTPALPSREIGELLEDEWDAAVYAAAKARFERDVTAARHAQRHGRAGCELPQRMAADGRCLAGA